MKKQKIKSKVMVFDLPTRLLHWLFGILFIFSFSIGKLVDDDSILYTYHMLSGLLMAFMVGLRLFWGVIGTKYARFSSFKLKPKELIIYFQSILNRTKYDDLAHNPASSFAAIIMFVLTLFLVATGLLTVNRVNKELFEEIHELLALFFLLVVIIHITGVFLHQMRYGDGLIYSMFNGLKETSLRHKEASSKSLIALLIFILLISGFTSYIISNFNHEKGYLSIFGTQLQLVEIENEHDVDYYNKYYNMLENKEKSNHSEE